MQKVRVNCQTGRITIVDLTPQEEAQRRSDAEQGQMLLLSEKTKAEKHLLLSLSAELREMNDNKDVFASEDIIIKESQIAVLKDKIAISRT